MKRAQLFAASLLSILTLVSCSDSTSVVVCHTGKYVDPNEFTNEVLNQDMTVCQVGEFTLQVPAEPRDDILSLMVLREGKPMLSVTKEHGSIYMKNSLSTVTAADKNADGVADFLSYETKLDGMLATVRLYDRNLDGEMEMKVIHRHHHGTQVWCLIEGEWYQRIDGGDQPSVLIDGVRTPCVGPDVTEP